MFNEASMTNLEYIKTMNEEQFTDFMLANNLDRCLCPTKENCCLYDSCSDAFTDWLKAEYIKDSF